MPLRGATLFPYLAAFAAVAALGYAVTFGTLPPADFTFANGTEIKSVDPAIVTGQPEGRVINAIFEGLVNWDPRTLGVTPGVAERWEISEDGLEYTFHLRPDARWSDGSPITADDFVYSFRRFLDPLTGAEYSYQMWYVKNAKRFNTGSTALVEGDPVEIVLPDPPADAPPFALGEIVRGRLLKIEKPADEQSETPPVYVVEVSGKTRRFVTDAAVDASAELCQEVVLDFAEVGVKKLDTHTLRLTLQEPTPFFLSLTGFYPLFPVNRRCVETYGYPAWTRPENLVSNGAFRLHSRRIRDRARLVKSETYWNAKNVRLNVVDALAVESDTTALNLYMTGQVDWLPKAPPTVVPELLKQKRADFSPTPYLANEFYRLNTKRKPLDDVRVRKALSLAINRREIVDTITRAGEVPALSLVPPGIEGYRSPQSGDFNPEAARALLAEAGYPGGRGFPKMEILYNPSEAASAVAQLIQSQWETVLGIDVGPRQEEWNSYLTSQQQLQYDISRAGWIGDYADPNTFLDMFLTGGANNQTGWSNKRYDELIAAAAVERDSAKRMQLLHEVETILLDEMPIIPLFYPMTRNLVRPYVRGFYSNIQDVHPLDAIWIDEEAKQKFFAEGDPR